MVHTKNISINYLWKPAGFFNTILFDTWPQKIKLERSYYYLSNCFMYADEPVSDLNKGDSVE